MAADYIYQAKPDRPAPAAGGDELSWLLYYKWGYDVGPTWVPAPEGIQAGDRLWFAADNVVLGHVIVTRVEENFHANRLEAYYDAGAAIVVWGKFYAGDTGKVSPEEDFAESE